MRKTVFLGNTEYTREVVLLDNKVLQELQRISLKDNSSLSESLNKLLLQVLNNG